VTADDNWTWSFTELPKKADGEDITYTLTEETISEYTAEIGEPVTGKDGVIDITNTHTPEVITITGTKTWDDLDDVDQLRPVSINITLTGSDGKTYEKTVTADDNWTWSFENLPKKANGQDITYTLTEEAVPEYSTVIGEPVTGRDGVIDITNSHKTNPPTGDSSASKWIGFIVATMLGLLFVEIERRRRTLKEEQ
ncbi:MAG: Cna B-type domain-containing protein, partial [Clostridia bacterium]|nr:Cna B-type domain-containing protein [Clostridia bacterium]